MKNSRILEILLQKNNLILFIALLWFSSAYARNNAYRTWCDSLNMRIDSLLEDEMFFTSQVGICIYDLTENNYIYSYNDMQTMRPASTQKLITAITALKIMGPDHRIYTTVGYTGDMKSRTLHGDVYFKGSFDPLLDEKSLNELARGIKEFGIDSINGNIFVDKSMKDSVLLGEGWCWDDENPILSPLTVNGEDNFSEKINDVLKDSGITILGISTQGRCPEDANLICRTYHTLNSILPEMLKESDNFFAESLFYNIAASTEIPEATSKEAVRVIDRLAKKLGHKASEYRIADGSGLSLYNYTTPRILTDFLRYAYNRHRIYTSVYAALPIAGVDGTLKRRMKDYKNTKGNVHAKTGSVTCVSSLAGYCRAANGHDIAFCIINQGVLKSKNARDFQDKVCALLCEGVNCKLN